MATNTASGVQKTQYRKQGATFWTDLVGDQVTLTIADDDARRAAGIARPLDGLVVVGEDARVVRDGQRDLVAHEIRPERRALLAVLRLLDARRDVRGRQRHRDIGVV